MKLFVAAAVAAVVMNVVFMGVAVEAKHHVHPAALTPSVPMQSCSWLGNTIHGTTNFATSSAWKTIYFENRQSITVTVEAVTSSQDETATLAATGGTSGDRAVMANFVGGGNLAVTASASGVAMYHCQ